MRMQVFPGISTSLCNVVFHQSALRNLHLPFATTTMGNKFLFRTSRAQNSLNMKGASYPSVGSFIRLTVQDSESANAY